MQTCVVSGGTGTIAKGHVGSVTVNCATDTFAISGSVTGLAGAGLVLVEDAGDTLGVNVNGTFAFAKSLEDGSPCSVHVGTQPTARSQTCTMTREQGTIAGAPVTSIGIVCGTNSYATGGTVSGLTGTSLVLEDNGWDDIPIADDGTFTFAMSVMSGEPYAVTVKTQRMGPSEECSVVGGSAAVGSGKVQSVAGDVREATRLWLSISTRQSRTPRPRSSLSGARS